jgi:hypothetical protein
MKSIKGTIKNIYEILGVEYKPVVVRTNTARTTQELYDSFMESMRSIQSMANSMIQELQEGQRLNLLRSVQGRRELARLIEKEPEIVTPKFMAALSLMQTSRGTILILGKALKVKPEIAERNLSTLLERIIQENAVFDTFIEVIKPKYKFVSPELINILLQMMQMEIGNIRQGAALALEKIINVNPELAASKYIDLGLFKQVMENESNLDIKINIIWALKSIAIANPEFTLKITEYLLLTFQNEEEGNDDEGSSILEVIKEIVEKGICTKSSSFIIKSLAINMQTHCNQNLTKEAHDTLREIADKKPALITQDIWEFLKLYK